MLLTLIVVDSLPGKKQSIPRKLYTAQKKMSFIEILEKNILFDHFSGILLNVFNQNDGEY